MKSGMVNAQAAGVRVQYAVAVEVGRHMGGMNEAS